MLCLFVVEFFMFLTIGPVNIAILNTVKPHLRGQAVAINIFVIHLFGDFPSPILVGVMNEYIGMYLAIMVLLMW
jgi:hypothetical protein